MQTPITVYKKNWWVKIIGGPHKGASGQIVAKVVQGKPVKVLLQGQTEPTDVPYEHLSRGMAPARQKPKAPKYDTTVEDMTEAEAEEALRKKGRQTGYCQGRRQKTSEK